MTMRDVVLDSGDDVTGLVDEDWSDVETPIDRPPKRAAIEWEDLECRIRDRS
jgi:hypothetical protein